MLRHLRLLAAALVLGGLLVALPTSAVASSSDYGYGTIDSETAPPMFDLLVMRPLGMVGLGASALLWLPAEAITMAVRPEEWRKPIDYMLVKPYEFVFVDPLGSH